MVRAPMSLLTHGAGGGSFWSKFTVYVVSAAGVVTTWVCAPPSDQLRYRYCLPSRVCGDAALSVRSTPTTAVSVRVAVYGMPSTAYRSPSTLALNVRCTRFGLMFTDEVCCSPP